MKRGDRIKTLVELDSIPVGSEGIITKTDVDHVKPIEVRIDGGLFTYYNQDELEVTLSVPTLSDKTMPPDHEEFFKNLYALLEKHSADIYTRDGMMFVALPTDTEMYDYWTGVLTPGGFEANPEPWRGMRPIE